MEPPEASRPVLRLYLRWFFLILAIGIAAGLSSALFLWLLEISTATFTRHPQLIYGLPAAGGLHISLMHMHGRARNAMQAAHMIFMDMAEDAQIGVVVGLADAIGYRRRIKHHAAVRAAHDHLIAVGVLAVLFAEKDGDGAKIQRWHR